MTQTAEERAEWLAERPTYIGGSDVFRILSGDALGIYCEKKGLVEPKADNEFMEWGRRLERPILEEYAERTGYTLEYFTKPFRHPKYPFLAANVDAIATTPHKDRRVPDAKNVSQWKGEECGADGESIAPEGYVLQIMHYCYVLGIDAGDLVALQGGNRLTIHPFKYDKELYEEYVLPALISFWRGCIETNTPPDAVFDSENALDLQKAMHRKVVPVTDTIPATDGVLRLIATQKQLKAYQKGIDQALKSVEAELLSLAGDNKVTLVGDTGIKLTRSEIKPTWVPAFEKKGYVRFSVTVPKNATVLENFLDASPTALLAATTEEDSDV